MIGFHIGSHAAFQGKNLCVIVLDLQLKKKRSFFPGYANDIWHLDLSFFLYTCLAERQTDRHTENWCYKFKARICKLVSSCGIFHSFFLYVFMHAYSVFPEKTLVTADLNNSKFAVSISSIRYLREVKKIYIFMFFHRLAGTRQSGCIHLDSSSL